MPRRMCLVGGGQKAEGSGHIRTGIRPSLDPGYPNVFLSNSGDVLAHPDRVEAHAFGASAEVSYHPIGHPFANAPS